MKRFFLWFILLFFVFFVISAEQIPFPDLNRPGSILVESGQIVINDGEFVYIYSAKTFSLVKKIGKQGEGPGEFKIHPNINRGGVGISVHSDYILVSSIGRVSFFSRNGEYIKEIKTTSMFGNYYPLKRKYAGTGFTQESDGDYITVSLYNNEFKKEKLLFKEKAIGKGKKLNAVALLKFPKLCTFKDIIFVNAEGGIIHRYDHGGNELPGIKTDIEPVKVTGDREKRYDDFFKIDNRFKQRYEQLKQIAEYPEFFPLIRDYHVAENKIYVLTYRERDNKRLLVIHNMNEGDIKKIFVPIEEMNVLELFPYTIKNGKIYQLKENQDSENWELYITDI